MKKETSYKLASRKWKEDNKVVEVGENQIGSDEIFLIAGPCAIESAAQMEVIASFISKLGVPFMRGGAYKPRTSPYSFQGLEKEGLRIMKQTAEKYNLGVITEVMDLSLLETVYPYTDIIQVGSRNMKNYHFLKELGKTDKPVLLKRGMDATIEEWLLAAEYVLLGGNSQVILCERGIRTFDTSSRNTLDATGIALVKQLSHLPVISDPSQATGNRNLILPTALASIAAGADGLMIEIHNNPENALSDGPQSMFLDQFENMLPQLSSVVHAVGKTCSWHHSHETVNI